MAGLDDLLGLIAKAVEVKPAYTPTRCLNSSEGAGSCTACLDACPHDAITIPKLVEVDGVDCTGCGICVRACPSQALEMTNSLRSLPAVRCSQVPGEATSVRCLAQLSTSDMLRAAPPTGKLLLAHGACEGCKVGDATVPAVTRGVADEAEQLAALVGRPLHVTVERRDRLDKVVDEEKRVSRRELFGGGLFRAGRAAADALEPLERMLPTGEPDPELPPLPAELTRQYETLAAAGLAGEALVPWRLPRVDDGCILCPACTRACPTDAFSRDLANGVLKLEPDRCVGCDACVRACPVNVISMDDDVSWGELSGGTVTAYRSSDDGGLRGALHR